MLVVRHAVAMEKDEYIGHDDFRPLTLAGIRKMKKNSKALAKLVENPQLLATSPLVRAQQTSEILHEVWPDVRVVESDELRPDKKPQALATWMNSHLESGLETVVIVGHEPHLSHVVQWMTGGHVDLKKGGACLIEFDDRCAKHSGQIKWLATPRFLRAL